MSAASPKVNLEIWQETYKQLTRVFEQQDLARQGTWSCESGLRCQSQKSGLGKIKNKGNEKPVVNRILMIFLKITR